MFARFVEVGVFFLVGATLLTQVLLPLFIPSLDLFWLFKGKKPKEQPVGPKADLDATVAHLKEEVITHSTALNSTLSEVDNSINALEDIKKHVQN